MPEFNAYTIVGFDVRQPPILDLGGVKKLGDYWPTDWPIQQPYPPTISDPAWPRSTKCETMDYPETNGIHLMCLPDAQFLDREAVSVAFSLRAKDAKTFEQSSWILPVDEGYLSKSCGWKLLGYDVADAWLAHSGFYGFTWKPGEMAPLFVGHELVFNRHGLLEDEDTAIFVADVFTREHSMQSHSPFYPVRVWIQEEGGRKDDIKAQLKTNVSPDS